MKKILILVLMLALLSAAVSAQTLRVTMVNQDPDPVRAGDVVEVKFKVENFFEDTRDDIKLEVVPEYPFTMYESSNSRNLGRLEGGQTGSEAALVTFKLKVDANAVDGDNKLIVNLYNGAAKAKYEDFFVIVKNEKISLKPYISASDLITSGNRGKFTVEIANTGNNDVKALELKLLTSEDYKLLSTSNYVYIGDLNRDDTESEDFDIYVAEGVKEVHIPLELIYEVNEHGYKNTENLVLNLLTIDEAKQVGLIKSNNTLTIIILIVVLILGYLVYRKLKKRWKIT